MEFRGLTKFSVDLEASLWLFWINVTHSFGNFFNVYSFLNMHINTNKRGRLLLDQNVLNTNFINKLIIIFCYGFDRFKN